MSGTDWPVSELRQSLAPLLPGLAIEVETEIDSTNAELMRRIHHGTLVPTLLVAEHQSAGRGRLGRTWHDRRDAHGAPGSLMFSLALPMTARDWSGLSLAVGLSLAHSLHPDIALKWPNDLWWHDRKLAGILVQTHTWSHNPDPHARQVVVGVGINLVPPARTDLSTDPVGLNELLPGITAGQALLRVCANLVRQLQQFEQHGFAPLQTDFNARDALAGVPVVLSDGTQGVAHGVDATGALQVDVAGQRLRVTSAEVSVRPQTTPRDFAH